MSNWLSVLEKAKPIRLVKPRTALNSLLQGHDSVVFEHLDDPTRFEQNHALRNMARITERFFGNSQSRSDLIPLVGLLQRNPSLPFYSSADSEIATSGADRRSIGNPVELAVLLAKYGQTLVLDTSMSRPSDAVKLYSSLDVLVGQTGAGLVNMIWMKPGSFVVEVRAPGALFGYPWDDCYKLLAQALKLNYLMVDAQQDWHSDVDTEKLDSSLGQFLPSREHTNGRLASVINRLRGPQ